MVNLMFDRRVIRGNTYSLNNVSSSAASPPDHKANPPGTSQSSKKKGKDVSLRNAVLSRRQLLGRSKPCDVEKEEERDPADLLSEIPNVREERKISFAAAVQTDKIESVERNIAEMATSKLSTQQSKETQILPSDSIISNFNTNVKCYLERIVAITVEKSLIECYDEEDKKLSRKLNLDHQDHLMALKI